MFTSNNQRNYAYDVVRSFAFLWIVSYHYFAGELFHRIDGIITQIALGAFFYISGRLSSKRYQFDSMENILLFLKKRLIRIYPLYLLCVLTMPSVTDSYDIVSRLQALAFINPYCGAKFRVIWFVGALFNFFLLTPLICRKRLGSSILLCVIIQTGLCCLPYVDKCFDVRMALFFPFYTVGVLMNKVDQNFSKFASFHNRLDLPWFFHNKICFTIFSFLTYESFAGYLFHIHCYSIVEAIYDGNQKWVVVCVAFILTLLLSFLLQKGFDTILLKIRNRAS